MAFIVFNMLEEPGHILPTFKLARGLVSRGHRVAYLEPPDLEGFVRAQGFEVVPLSQDLYPKCTASRLGQLGPLEFLRKKCRCADTEMQMFESGAMSRQLRSLGASLMLVDQASNAVALAAYAAKIPCAILNTTLPAGEDTGIAPLVSSAVYGDDFLSRLRAKLAWRSLLGRRHVETLLLGPMEALGLTLDPRPDWGNWVRRYAAMCGYPVHRVELRTTFSLPELLDFQEFVLCPSALDFPRQSRPGRVSIESIDVNRHEEPTPELDSWLDGRRLVYATLGSLAFRYHDCRSFFQALLVAARSLPLHQFVIGAGDVLSQDEINAAPENVRVIRFAPQIRLLRRASLMITHGGLGTVKECLYHGVPMIVFPQAYDQSGNGARVVYHRVGAVAPARGLTPTRLAALVRQVDGDPTIRRSVARMKEQFQEHEREAAGVALVESLIPDRRASLTDLPAIR